MRLTACAALLTVALAALTSPAGVAGASPTSAGAEEPTRHVVQPGQTLGGIARRHRVKLEALLRANGLSRRDSIRPGQVLLVPPADDPDGSRTAASRRPHATAASAAGAAEEAPTGVRSLAVPGSAPAVYYEPVGAGRLGQRPVIVYLHGRGANPAADCARWARIAPRHGWLLCPAGQEDRGGGARGWDNSWPAAQHVVLGALEALRARFGRRVQLYGNTLVGFSEGAYVAMNVGVRSPRVFNRWLILAADTDYWGGPGLEALAEARRQLRGVFLVTGEHDGVAESTRTVHGWLERAGVRAELAMPADLGHEVALERKPALYDGALTWLARPERRKAPARRAAPARR